MCYKKRIGNVHILSFKWLSKKIKPRIQILGQLLVRALAKFGRHRNVNSTTQLRWPVQFYLKKTTIKRVIRIKLLPAMVVQLFFWLPPTRSFILLQPLITWSQKTFAWDPLSLQIDWYVFGFTCFDFTVKKVFTFLWAGRP